MKTDKILIVVDMQKDFIDGALGTIEAQSIVDGVVEKIKKYKAEEYHVLATMDTHEENYLDTREGRYLPIEHCITGTDGWQLDSRVSEALGFSVTLRKSTFGSLDLPEYVKELTQPEKDGKGLTIEIVGLCTDICVVSNALILKAAFPEADIYVDASLCAGVTATKHKAAIKTMKSCQIDIVNG